MNSVPYAARHQIYPKRYFDESPTWFKWNKLTVADVMNLRQEPGFEGQHIYFNLNHPIQFIRLVGIIVQIDLVGQNGKFCLMTLDDGSGANIEIKIERERNQLALDRPEYLPVTDVEGLQVFVKLSLPVLQLGRNPLGLGDVIRAQGTLTEFWNQKQLVLKRLFRVRSTNEEAEHWQNAAEWKRDVLEKPWVLTQGQRNAIDEKIRLEGIKEGQVEKMKQKSKSKEARKQKRREAKEEEAREAEEQKLNIGALEGSEILPLPWD